jgi:flavin reductase (DIM6/NTAB) family NADH-FMN oxidoreductase RutF
VHHVSKDTISAWDSRYRGNFINSLSGFKSVSLIGTVNASGQPNVAVFSNIVHIGANPAIVGFINRPLAAAPHTLANIQATGCYTINHITPSMVAQAHQTSAKYNEGVSEFAQTGLSELYREGCPAPFVAHSAVQYSMALLEVVPIKHNGTFFVIGAVQEVYLRSLDCVGEDGFIALTQLETVASLGMDGYYSASPLARYAYAKPNVPPTLL